MAGQNFDNTLRGEAYFEARQAQALEVDLQYFADYQSRLHYAVSEGTHLPILPDYSNMAARYRGGSAAKASFAATYQRLEAAWSEAYLKQSVEFYNGAPTLTHAESLSALLSTPDAVPELPIEQQSENSDSTRLNELSSYTLSQEPREYTSYAPTLGEPSLAASPLEDVSFSSELAASKRSRGEGYQDIHQGLSLDELWERSFARGYVGYPQNGTSEQSSSSMSKQNPKAPTAGFTDRGLHGRLASIFRSLFNF